MPRDVWAIQHCEEPTCSVGRINYICPVCGKEGDDYDLWWSQQMVYDGETVDFQCERCKAPLVFSAAQSRLLVTAKS